MANNKSDIKINIGFESVGSDGIEQFISNIQDELKKIDMDKTLGFSDGLKKQFTSLTTAVDKLQKSLSAGERTNIIGKDALASIASLQKGLGDVENIIDSFDNKGISKGFADDLNDAKNIISSSINNITQMKTEVDNMFAGINKAFDSLNSRTIINQNNKLDFKSMNAEEANKQLSKMVQNLNFVDKASKEVEEDIKSGKPINILENIEAIQDGYDSIKNIRKIIKDFPESENISKLGINTTYLKGSKRDLDDFKQYLLNYFQALKQDTNIDNTIPIKAKLVTQSTELNQSLDLLINALNKHAQENPIRLNIGVASANQKQTDAAFKTLSKQIDKIDNEKAKKKYNDALNKLATNYNTEFEARIKTDKYKKDAEEVREYLSKISTQALEIASMDLKLHPTVSLKEGSLKKIEQDMKLLNAKLSGDMSEIGKNVANAEMKIKGATFASQLDMVISKLKGLSDSDNTNGIKNIASAFNALKNAVNTIDSKGNIKEIAKNISLIRNAMKLKDEDNGVAHLVSEVNQLITVSDKIPDATKNLNDFLKGAKTNPKGANTAITKSSQDITAYMQLLESFITTHDNFVTAITTEVDTAQLSNILEVAKTQTEALKTALSNLSPENIKGTNEIVAELTSLADALDKLITQVAGDLYALRSNIGFFNELEIDTSIEDNIKSLIEQIEITKQKLVTLTDDEGKLSTLNTDLHGISNSIDSFNQDANSTSVLSLLDSVLSKRDSIIALSSLFGKSIGDISGINLNVPEETKNNAIKNEFYNSANKAKELLNNVFDTKSLTSVEDYYRELEKVTRLYIEIRNNKGNIGAEEFEKAKVYVEQLAKELQTKLMEPLTTLHPALASQFKKQIGELKGALNDSTLSLKSDKSLENINANKQALVGILNLSKEIEKTDALSKMSQKASDNIEEFYNKINNIPTAFSKAISEGSSTSIDSFINKIRTVLNLKNQLEEAKGLKLISADEFKKVDETFNSLIKDFTEIYKIDLKNIFGQNSLNNYSEDIDAIDSKIVKLFGDLNKIGHKRARSAFKGISSDVADLKQSLKDVSTFKDEVTNFVSRLSKLKDLQFNAFQGNQADTALFIESLNKVIVKYEELKEISNKNELNNEFKTADEAAKEMFSTLSNGLTILTKDLNYIYTDSSMLNQIKILQKELQDAFSGENIDISRIKEITNEIQNSFAGMISKQNIQANGLSFDKLLGKIYNSLVQNSKAAEEDKQKLRELAKEMESLGSANTSKTMLDAFAKSFQSLDTQIKRSGKTGKGFFDRLGSSFTTQTTQIIATTFSIYRLFQVFKQGVDTVTDFDLALAKINYTMDVSETSLNAMGQSIIKLSNDLKTSISDMESIYTIYANMNTSPEEIEELSKYTAILTNLSGIDASAAADDIQAVVNQFENLNSTDTSHIVDVFDYISRNIAVDYQKGIEGVAEGVQAVGNVADQAGLSYEQLSAIIAKTMEQTRNSGSSIANGLKTIMVRLSKASSMSDEVDNATLSKASSVLHEIGVEVYTASGEYREFDTIMTELAAKWDSLTEAQQANISFQIAATRQTATLKAILQNWTESMDLANEAVYTQGNALENQEKHAETYAAKIQEMKNSFETLAINLMNTDGFDALLSTIEKATQGISDFVSAFGLIPTVTAGAMLIPFIKNLGSLKQNLSSATDSGKLVIKTMKDINSSNIVYSKNYEKLALALNGLNANQAKLVISNSQVAKSERKVAMAEYERLNATLKLTRSQVLEKFNNRGLEDSQVTSINTQLSEAYNSNKWSKATIMNMLSDEKLHIDPKLQEEIIKDIEAENVQYSKQIGLLGNLKEKYTAFAASLGLTAKQLTAVLGVIGSLYIAYRVFDKLIVSEKEYEEKSIESLERITKVLGEIDQINSELENTTQKLKELESQDTISLADQGEINKLKETNTELERSLRAKKELAKVEADLATETAEEDPTLKKYKGYQPIVTEAPEKARNYYRHKRKDEYFTDTKSGLITVNGFDTPYEALIATAEAYREALESDSEKADEIKKTLDELYAKNEKKYEIFQKAIEAGNDYSDNEYYQGTVSGRNAYFKSLFESNPNDLDAFKLMSKEDKISAFSEQFEKALKQQSEALNISANEIDNYMNSAKGALKDLSSEKLDELFNKKIDFSKYIIPEEELNNKLKTYDILGKAFEYSISDNNASKYHEAQIGSYITHLYVKAKEALDATGKEYSDKKLFAEMFKLDESGEEVHEVNEAGKVIGRIFIQGILDTPSAATNPFGRLIEAWLKDVTETKENKISFEEAWAGLDNEETGTKLKESLTKLADEGKLTKENFLKEDGAKTWADKLNIDLDEAIKKINSLSKDTSRLSNLKGSVSKLQNAYSEKRDAVLTNKDQTKQKGKLNKVEAASASTINDLEADFGGLKYWKKYKEIIGSTTSTLDECREATNKLLTEFYNKGKYINEVVDATGNVNEATRQYYISQMEELGIANAEEVVNKEILQSKTELWLTTKNLDDITVEHIDDLQKEASALNTMGVDAQWAAKMVNALTMQKIMANHESLADSGDLPYLQKLKSLAEKTGIAVSELTQAEIYYARAEEQRKRGGGGYYRWLLGKAKELEKKAETNINKELTTGLNFQPTDLNETGSNESKTTSNDAKKKTKEEFDWIARYIDEQQHKIDLATAKLENAFGEKKRNKIYNSIVKYYKNIAQGYKVGLGKRVNNLKAYLKKNAKYLSPDLIDKIKNGRITGDSSKLIQKYGGKRAEIIKGGIERQQNINEYRKNYQTSLTEARKELANKYQDQADRRQAKSDYKRQLSEAEEKGYKYQNEKLKEAYKYQEASLKKQIKVAKINHDITEQKKLQAQLAQLDNSLAKEQFDNTIAYFERLKGAITDRKEIVQSQIDLASAKGANASVNYYRDIQKADNELINKNKQAIIEARKDLAKTVVGTDERRDAEAKVNALLVEQNNLMADIAQQNQNILATYTKYIDAVRSGNNRIADELSFLDGLADYDKHTSDEIKGFFTDAGKAALDATYKGFLISQKNAQFDKENYKKFFKAYNDPAIKAALDAGKTIDIITAQGEKVTINSFEQLRLEVDKYYDNWKGDIKSTYDYQNKIFELEKEKYTEELNLVKKLIDAKKKELDAEKDLHDYQRTISEKTTNITNLERQLAAYSGNTSEEGRAKLQSLQKQLSDAQKDLEETEYDRYISDQKNMLDELQTEYEEQINKYLEDFKARVDEGFKDAIANIKDGNEYLKALAKEYGYEPQYDDLGSIKELTKTINKLDSNIESESGLNGKGGSSKTNNTSTKEDLSPRQSFVIEKPQKLKNNNKTADQDAKIKGTRDSLKKKIKNIVDNSKYQKKDTKNISEVNKLIYKEYKKALTTTGLKEVAKVLGVPYDNDKNSKLWKSIKDLYGFSKGGIASIIKKNGDDGIATLKRGEAVLTPLQSKQFAVLAKNLEHINSLMYAQQLANAKYEALMDLQQAQMEHQVAMQKILTGHDKSASFDGDVNFYFELHDVQNPQMFLQQIKNDYKIQKALQEVTIKQLIEPNKLGVKKIK